MNVARASALALTLVLVAGCGSPGGQVAPPTPPPATSAPTAAAIAATHAPTAIPATDAPSPTVLPSAPAETVAPTPDCGGGVTPSLTEGPYFTPNSPERASLLEADTAGTRIVISGYVLSAECRPVAGALLDFWQADADGVYDNAGYRLRGHQFTDANGRYVLETIVPGLYTGRTEHIHVKVQAPGGPVLTTQLFFPDAPENSTDRIFNAALVLPVQETADGLAAAFDFVVP